jgi:cGMP-dependent protein kinase
MAPEILIGKGYNHLCDLWSVGKNNNLGICVYEFFCGGVPYGEELDDPFQIHEVILKSRGLKFPHLENKHTK